MARILIVEDEPELSDVVCEWLTDEHHLVETAPDGLEAVRMIGRQIYDLIVLDIMLPGISGIEVCQQLRKNGAGTPVLMLTARTTITDKEAGLDSGADDYLTKPFHLRELSARVRALLRRQQTAPALAFGISDLVLDRNACAAVRTGTNVVIDLHPKEFALLEFLVRNQGQLFTADELIDRIWGVDSHIVPETVRTYIKTLRKKIDVAGRGSLIQNIRGMGYKLEDSNV